HLLLIGHRATDGGVVDAAVRVVVGVVRVVDVGEAIVGPGGAVPVLDHGGLVVAHALRVAPFLGEDARAGGEVVHRVGGDALAVEIGRLADVHPARDLGDAIAAVEGDD